MKRAAILGLAVLAVGVLGSLLPDAVSAADAPADRVVVMYFHRTVRCPTCQKMGTYTEEAVKSGFAEQLKAGTVEFHSIDFQDAKNAKLSAGYGVAGPTLIVTKVTGGKVVEKKNLKDIWANAGNKAAFVKYVQTNVKGYVK
jgi:hypothetical protein